MSRTDYVPNEAVKARRNRREIETGKKAGPESWLYLGTFPTDSYTTIESPPYENGYDFDTYPVKLRWDEHYRHEWGGKLDLTQGAVTGDRLCVLPDEWISDASYSFPIDVEDPDDPTIFFVARVKVHGNDSATPGDVYVYWPQSIA